MPEEIVNLMKKYKNINFTKNMYMEYIDKSKNNLDKINEINKQKFDELENIYNTTMCLVSHFGNIQI